jgi:hypothetical protein
VDEQIHALAKCLLCRMRLNFAEGPETLMSDMREIAPTSRLYLDFDPKTARDEYVWVLATTLTARPMSRAEAPSGWFTSWA